MVSLPGDPRLPGNRCECGNRKAWSAFACPRCTHLDGTKLAALVIETLRDVRALSIHELALRIFGKADKHNERRSLQRTLEILMRAGRIMRYRGDVEAEATAFGLYDARRHTDCWMYRGAA